MRLYDFVIMCLCFNTRIYECGCEENTVEYIMRCELSIEEGITGYDCPHFKICPEMEEMLCDLCYIKSLDPK